MVATVLRALPVLALLALLLPAAPATARPGDVDQRFGTGGGYAGPSCVAYAIVERANRKLFLHVNDGVMQLTRSGPPDLAFGRAGEVRFDPPTPDDVVSATLDRRGRAILVATDPSRDAYDLVRLGRDGAPDLTLGPGGRRRIQGTARRFRVDHVAVDRRNRVLLAGRARVAGRFRVVVARLRAGGAPDRRFGRRGFAIGPRGAVLDRPIVQRGRIVVPMRTAARRSANRRTALLALRTNGRRLRGYGRRGVASVRVRGRRFVPTARFASGPGRSIVATGEVRSRRRAVRTAVFATRLRASGRVDRRFGTRGLVRLRRRGLDLYPAAVTTDRRGRVLIAANERPTDRVVVFRLRRGGARDRGFGRRGARRVKLGGRTSFATTGSDANAITVARSGRILVAGVLYDDDAGNRDGFGNPHVAVTALRG